MTIISTAHIPISKKQAKKIKKIADKLGISQSSENEGEINYTVELELIESLRGSYLTNSEADTTLKKADEVTFYWN